MASSMELCARAVRSCTDYERDPDKLMALRGNLAEAIISASSRPLMLLKTEPPASAPIVPSVVRISGLTEKGASVTVNRKDVPVGKDGRFQAQVKVSEAPHDIKVTVRRGDDERPVMKRFTVVDEDAGELNHY